MGEDAWLEAAYEDRMEPDLPEDYWDEDEEDEHPDDCLLCEAGEPMVHNYEPPA